MKPWTQLAKSGDLSLHVRDGEYLIRTGSHELMSSKRSRSEEAMAAFAAGRKRVLIGGLGFGCTLRATLKVVPRDAHVVVAELFPVVVEWAQKVEAPIGDPRVQVELKDVATIGGKFDAILLDTDNGPTALSAPGNAKLYTLGGIHNLAAKLSPGGVLVVWSAGPDAAFVKRLGQAGLRARAVPQRRHSLLVGEKPE